MIHCGLPVKRVVASQLKYMIGLIAMKNTKPYDNITGFFKQEYFLVVSGRGQITDFTINFKFQFALKTFPDIFFE